MCSIQHVCLVFIRGEMVQQFLAKFPNIIIHEDLLSISEVLRDIQTNWFWVCLKKSVLCLICGCTVYFVSGNL
jgi:hypothetical protein